ncbi:Acetylcholinesterase-1 [Blattella germanica]|nr:Acetylcholinesterase-1 [Blattella germanica]
MNALGVVVILLSAMWALSVGIVHGQEPMVMLRQGALKGIRVYTEDRRIINAFLGVPYASPPVGQLRFAVSI